MPRTLWGTSCSSTCPEEGDSVTAGEAFCDVESVKAVSDVFSPVTGTVTAVNEDLLDDPAQVNEAPYEAWLIKVGEVTRHRGAAGRRRPTRPAVPQRRAKMGSYIPSTAAERQAMLQAIGPDLQPRSCFDVRARGRAAERT